jgi:hypothetical protein
MTGKPRQPTARSIVWLSIKVVVLLLFLGLASAGLLTAFGIIRYHFT